MGLILTIVNDTDHSNFHLLFGMKNIFHRMSHEKLSAGERRKAGKIYCKSLLCRAESSQNSRCEAKGR